MLFWGLTALIIKSRFYIAVRDTVLETLQKSTAQFPTLSSKCNPALHAPCAAEADTFKAVQVSQAFCNAAVVMLQVALLESASGFKMSSLPSLSRSLVRRHIAAQPLKSHSSFKYMA
jgi:hypothetical protein